MSKTTYDPLSRCEIHETHAPAISAAQENIPQEETVQRLADFFKLFGDPTRLRILFALESRELCVCDLSAALGMHKSAISHQLKSLRQAHLVAARKTGRSVYYRLDDAHIQAILDQGLDHVLE